MTVQSTTARADYNGNGATTLFPVPFYFLDATHIQVLLIDNSVSPPTVSTKTLNSDYSVAGVGNQQGGSITMAVAPAALQRLTILRNVPFTQLIHYVPNDPFPAATHEQAIDQLTMETQELGEELNHTLRFPTYEQTSGDIPPASQRANTALTFDANGNPSYAPLPSSLGAGDLRLDVFVANGTPPFAFTPGTTTQLTLSRAPVSKGNCWVYWDGTPQLDFSLSGTTITFPSAIPSGISNVYVRIGTTLSVGTPAQQSVGDDSLVSGSKVSIITRNLWTLKSFGAVGDGVVDDTVAVQAALDSDAQEIFLEPGNYKISSVTLTRGNLALRGAGINTTRFVSTSATQPAISIPTVSLVGIEMSDFGIFNAAGVIPGPGAHGLYWPLVTDYSKLSNLMVVGRYHGFFIGPAAYGVIENCRAERNLGDGFRFESSANIAGVAIQWNLDTLLSQMNVGSGYLFKSNGGTGNISVGTCRNLNSFGNSVYGIGVLGTSTCPIQGFRLRGGFLGGDGNHEVYLDTYGSEIQISNVFTELAGTSGTGPGLVLNAPTPPSNIGSGFYATANNTDVHLTDVLSSSHSQNGLLSAANLTTITGGKFFNNGLAGDSSNAAGVFKLGNVLSMSGGVSGNIGASTFQLYGVAASNGTGLHVVGANLLNNTLGPESIGVSGEVATLVGNLGGNTIIPAGAVTVGVPSGGTPTNGQINVASGIMKNGTLYNNP